MSDQINGAPSTPDDDVTSQERTAASVPVPPRGKQDLVQERAPWKALDEELTGRHYLLPPLNSSGEHFSSERLDSATSSIATSVSESLVDADKAGILGVGIYENAITTPSRPSHSDENLPRVCAKEVIKRRSVALTDPGVGEVGGRLGRNSSSYGRTIDEDHVNFVLMYDMLTGIRHAVSVCQAKMCRPLTNEDFLYNFLQDSSSTTPSKYEFRFKDYCPWVFRSLREAFRIDAADYLVSLTGKYALSEIGSPGKSGSFFYFSQDFRYIIKTIRQSEHEFLRKILRQYFDHIKRNPNSLLTRFYGLHRVRMSNIRKIYFVVMGNIFPPHKDIHETYDLKGSTLGRFVTPEEVSKKNLATLKDLNWIQRKRKLKLGPEKATLLINQLRADCLFLAKMKIMDYSLLVGIHYASRGNSDNIRGRSIKMLEPATPVAGSIHPGPTFKQSSFTAPVDSDAASLPLDEDGGYWSSLTDGGRGDEVYFLGIIDILTPYSMSKRLEHVFKSIQYDKRSISAINPQDYCRRFLRFMSDNILHDNKSDYATKTLPDIPDIFSCTEEADPPVVDNLESSK